MMLQIPEGVKFPLRIEWWNMLRSETTTPGESTSAQIIDSIGGTVIAEARSQDDCGFGQEEIDRLEFIVAAANLLAANPHLATLAGKPHLPALEARLTQIPWPALRESIQEHSTGFIEGQDEERARKAEWYRGTKEIPLTPAATSESISGASDWERGVPKPHDLIHGGSQGGGKTLRTKEEVEAALAAGYPTYVVKPVEGFFRKTALPPGAEHQTHGDAWARGTAETINRLAAMSDDGMDDLSMMDGVVGDR